MANNNSVWGGGMKVAPILTGVGCIVSGIAWIKMNSMFHAVVSAVCLIATIVIIVSVNRSK